ncbi:MAG TPA: hypothetical protein VLA46_12160 [Saprospiraceae bacterium]|nr:hypothetical protein [Saprospiraceae bacterium]
MGVDVGIKIRMLDESGNTKMEIEVSPQDNSLGSILDGSSEKIRYLSVSVNDEKFLTPDELAKIRLNYDPEEELMMYSGIIDSNEALRLFDKIFRFTYHRLPNSLDSDLSKINELSVDDEDKSKRRKSQISGYVGFEYSLGVAIGILKVAATSYPKVQIIGEYY